LIDRRQAQAYSDEFRRKFLEAYQAGEGSLPELAARFHVSVGWAKHISAALTHTGQMERPAGRKRGRRSRVTAEAQEYLAVAGEEAARPDLGDAAGRSAAGVRDPNRDHAVMEDSEPDGAAV
jgi:transposase-like protein